MTTLAVPYHCDGGADRAGTALGLQQSGSVWIGDCPGCKGSESLTVRPSRDGHRAHIICVCRGACGDATALRAALARTLGTGSRALPPKRIRMAADLMKPGGGNSRQHE